ncbi:hypothetical protein HELRODRAFT_174125 [Helobdella robusta]|uniref:Uncharacterized protein n=1 Tax=Helobdella robusta TaxID=6412 RepID=T1F7N5_HELRO|nr:hypothetical protein HELRODRAFT_174125 [Helobdella robusta]ESO03225.1 hypothetical protein HELRODRAFT_174125 [Helobdella robusta]
MSFHCRTNVPKTAQEACYDKTSISLKLKTNRELVYDTYPLGVEDGKCSCFNRLPDSIEFLEFYPNIPTIDAIYSEKYEKVDNRQKTTSDKQTTKGFSNTPDKNGNTVGPGTYDDDQVIEKSHDVPRVHLLLDDGFSAYSHCKSSTNVDGYDLFDECSRGCNEGWSDINCRKRDIPFNESQCRCTMKHVQFDIRIHDIGPRTVCACPYPMYKTSDNECRRINALDRFRIKLNETLDISARLDIRNFVKTCSEYDGEASHITLPMCVNCQDMQLKSKYVIIMQSEERSTTTRLAFGSIDVYEAGCHINNGNCGEDLVCVESVDEIKCVPTQRRTISVTTSVTLG